jgi:hypothetical protein
MKSAIILLERSTITPKHVWRDSSFCRTLKPIEVSHLITGAWKSNQAGSAQKGSIVMSLDPEGFAKQAPSVRAIQGEQKDFIGVFDVSFVAADRVQVVLREEECARRLASPGYRTRQIALLKPWKPIRVLLNGRSGSYSGTYYLLREYHLALCCHPTPDHLSEPRFLDLQVDLF